ncbi:MAG: hypothetical protein M1839_006526, partial [Geoglossum umbratile]
YGHKYTFEGHSVSGLDSDDGDEGSEVPALDTLISAEGEISAFTPNSDASGGGGTLSTSLRRPTVLGRREALDWVEQNLVQTRGHELAGNFNPLLIGELFWEQSENWEDIAQKHAEDISKLCTNFVNGLLQELCPQDVYARLSSSDINDALKQKLKHSQAELKNIIADRKLYPMTYNHYYTMAIQKLRSQRIEKKLAECVAQVTYQTSYYTFANNEKIALNMDDHSCSDALDCLYAYYKVALKTFTDNVPMQVMERHLVNNLEEIFSPLTVSRWSNEEILRLASEPAGVMRQRQFLEGRKKMLENGSDVFNGVLRASG